MAQSGVATEDTIDADAMVVVEHLDGLDALVAELPDVLRDGDPLEVRTGFLLDDETGDALFGSRRERNDAGAFTVGHPGLGATDEVLLTVTAGPTRDVARVAPGIRLGKRETPAGRALRETGKPTGLLLRTSLLHDQTRGDRVGVDDTRKRHPTGGQFLDHRDVRQEIEAEATELLGDRDAEQAHRLHLGDELSRVLVRAFQVRDDGQHLTLDPPPHRRPQLVPNLRIRRLHHATLR